MSQAEAVNYLIQAIRSYDPGLFDHSLGVANLSLYLGSLLGLQWGEAREVLFPGAMLHDVGKIYVDKSILYKSGPLSTGEWEVMRRHPEQGARLLAERKLDGLLQEIVLYHHERWDGKGYLSVRGESIPFLAQIVALADAIDAMSVDRAYRKALAPVQVRAEVRRCRGSQFASCLADALERSGFWPPDTGEEAVVESLLARERQWLARLVEMFGDLRHPLVQAQSRRLDRLVTAYLQSAKARAPE
ncbi:MAG: HD domain-containing protein [Clostridia bacterium]|nr:MAG: HD domain-containing protein [Clostridia bacterium]